MHLKGHQKGLSKKTSEFQKKTDLRFFSNHRATWQWPFPTRAPKSLHLKVSHMQALTCHSDSYMARTRPPSPSPILSYRGDRASPQNNSSPWIVERDSHIFKLNKKKVFWGGKKLRNVKFWAAESCFFFFFLVVVWPFNGTPWALVEGFWIPPPAGEKEQIQHYPQLSWHSVGVFCLPLPVGKYESSVPKRCTNVT